MSNPVNLNLEQLENWIEKNTRDVNQYFKSVHRLEDNKLIGLARLMYIDFDSRIAEIGLYVGDLEDRNGGYGVEILNHLVNIASNHYKLNKEFARIHEKNTGSIKLFEKDGFIVEGCLRDHYCSSLNSGYLNVLLFSKFL